MTQSRIYDELNTIFRDVLDDDTIVLLPETTAADLPGWDSQTHIMLIVAAETHFGIHFRTAELDRLHNVADFVDLIEARCAKNQGAAG
ncbi:acyl carrier protein [Acetobacter sp. TBRC 12305]|uniref:Acyl carrier protein n=1 Tax=Acetobacter garciniae TaxID=2817435 RepID=A0A939HQ81_9PROT|nr:acyl carrier protein [Acetobacter garciniae]MBO1325504.1 acyl carrier protein [Acetobacter garciniae]MBX0345324.1 acyl carrier protein [Acetobacter garciniae]